MLIISDSCLVIPMYFMIEIINKIISKDNSTNEHKSYTL